MRPGQLRAVLGVSRMKLAALILTGELVTEQAVEEYIAGRLPERTPDLVELFDDHWLSGPS
jgi:hypothetical protein